MKRIVILCDGTWNRSDSLTPTNVVRLGQLMKPISSVGIVQVPIYIPGVGTGKGVTRLSRLSDRILGGMFGWGLLENIAEAYRHLAFLYEPGDEIFIFGFSRGAFTARSLTGFIRATGIIERDRLHLIPKALLRYKTKGQNDTHHPNTEDSHRFRLKTSPRIATSEKEVSWRTAQGLTPVPVLRIEFLGVWDSVGALGVPRHLSVSSLLNRRQYEFHDADLSSMVRAARHAVALDERRRTFEPTRWQNLQELNEESPDPDPPYLEHFLLGDHGSVGGGGDLTHLSSIGLVWIAEGAQKAGLELSATALQKAEDEFDPLGLLRNTKDPPKGLANWIMRLRPRDRDGPDRIDDLHPSVLTRWAAMPEDARPYRPASLARVHAALTDHVGGDPARGDQVRQV
jgi:uncharacterized protein (DUF2235 family)